MDGAHRRFLNGEQELFPRLRPLSNRPLHRSSIARRQIHMADSAGGNQSSNSKSGKVWFITGASTGFGRLLAEEVLKAGGRVIATARKHDHIAELPRQYPETARALVLD